MFTSYMAILLLICSLAVFKKSIIGIVVLCVNVVSNFLANIIVSSKVTQNYGYKSWILKYFGDSYGGSL